MAATGIPIGHLPGSAGARSNLGEVLSRLDTVALCSTFLQQGSFVNLDRFLPEGWTAQLVEAASAVEKLVNRNYLPGHKQGGSVSRHTLDRSAPFIAELYRSPALIEWLQGICGERLYPSPANDPHAYALYFYTQPGDHIGWHYDTSYYLGRRYTLLIGVIDHSSCLLEYELHTREIDVATQPGTLQIPPGGLAFFDGDALRHRITPLAAGEKRVSLTFEYVTDPKMRPWWRLISNLKDAVAYFGFSQVFRRAAGARTLESE